VIADESNESLEQVGIWEVLEDRDGLLVGQWRLRSLGQKEQLGR